MSNYCCLNEESQEFKSLIFNAGTMNDGTWSILDTVPRILGWLLPQGNTDEYPLTFCMANKLLKIQKL